MKRAKANVLYVSAKRNMGVWKQWYHRDRYNREVAIRKEGPMDIAP